MKKTALVTGSTGFIGSNLCHALVNQGYRVRAFHRESSPLTLLNDLPVEYILGDLTQPKSLEAAMQGVQLVFHCAALVGQSKEPGRHYTVTVEGTRALLNAALAAGVERVVHTSSISALGVPEVIRGTSQPPLMDENHSWNFRQENWPYGYSKYLAEQEVQKAVAKGLDVVMVNPTFVYGPGDIYRQRKSIIMQIARRQLPFIMEGGLNVVHVEDVIAGHLAACNLGKTGQRYILGGQNLEIGQFVEKVAEITGVNSPRITLPTRLIRFLAYPMKWIEPFLNIPQSSISFHLAGYHFFYDLRKSRTQLLLAPPIPVERSIKDAYDWFVNMAAN